MKLSLGLAACLIMAIGANGAPQAGPPSGLPKDSYNAACQPSPCPATGSAKLAYPLDCLQYVECTEGKSEIKACPADMIWNEDTKNCGERGAANCKRCW